MLSFWLKKLKFRFLNLFVSKQKQYHSEDSVLIKRCIELEVQHSKYITDRHFIFDLAKSNRVRFKKLYVDFDGKASRNTLLFELGNSKILSRIETIDLSSVENSSRTNRAVSDTLTESIKHDYTLIKHTGDYLDSLIQYKELMSVLLSLFNTDPMQLVTRKIFKHKSGDNSFLVLEVLTEPNVQLGLINTLHIEL